MVGPILGVLVLAAFAGWVLLRKGRFRRRNPPGDAKFRLYYDGACNLCANGSARVAGWLGAALVESAPLQSERCREKGYGGDLVLEVERADGLEVLRGIEAWLELLRHGPPWVSWLAGLRRFAPTRWIAERTYAIIKKNRYKWFGTRVCDLPSTRNTRPDSPSD